jgi:DNA-binding NarL/FixJ family response regulator
MSSLKIPHLPDADKDPLLDTGVMKLSAGTPRSKWMHILLADRQPKVRFALRVLLERQPGVVVVGEAVNADDLISQTRAKRPDLILLDWDLPGLAQTGSLSFLRKICPEMLVIALSGHAEARQGALGAGADAFASKVDPPERLLATIRECSRRRLQRMGPASQI